MAPPGRSEHSPEQEGWPDAGGDPAGAGGDPARAGGEGPAGAAGDPAHDALRRLEERLDQASDAAERLLAQAASEAARTISAATPGGGGGREGGTSRGDGPGGGGGGGVEAGGGSASGGGRPGGRGPDAGHGPGGGAGGGPGQGGSSPSDRDPLKPPPAGWQAAEADATGTRAADAELLMAVIQSLRDLIPPDLQRRLADALREVLLAIRALIDWYLERLEQRRATPAQVEDIPIL